MTIMTHAPNNTYDRGFEDTFGRRCFYCRKTFQQDEVTPAEWQASTHRACEPKSSPEGQTG